MEIQYCVNTQQVSQLNILEASTEPKVLGIVELGGILYFSNRRYCVYLWISPGYKVTTMAYNIEK